MRSRRLLVLFVLALAAVGAFFAVELPRRRAEEDARRRAVRLFAFDPRAVDVITIERPDTVLRFGLAGTHWTMVEPLRDDAEAGAVVPLVTGLAEAEMVRDLRGAGDLSRYGLAPPAATVRLFARGDTVAALALGGFAVDRSAVYAQRGGGGVLLVPTSLHRAATLPADAYRNRRVAVFDLDAVRTFTITSRLTGTTRWARAGSGAWLTEFAGDTVRGDSIAVPALLRRLRGMRVHAFLAPADSALTPFLAVTLHKNDGSTQTVRFSAPHDGLCRARVDGNPRTVVVEDDPSDIAGATVATLRDRRVLHFDPAAARRITVTTADSSAVLVRAGDAWALPNPALGGVDAERAADLVRALRALRYERLVDTGGGPREDAPFSLVIFGDGDTILDALYCAPAAPGAPRTARSHSLDAVCEIDGSALDAIVARLSRLRR